jgi:hypothetical protein
MMLLRFLWGFASLISLCRWKARELVAYRHAGKLSLQAQQEVLARRRSGEAIKEAFERRNKVKVTMEERKAERRREKELLGQGIMPDTYRDWKVCCVQIVRALVRVLLRFILTCKQLFRNSLKH